MSSQNISLKAFLAQYVRQLRGTGSQQSKPASRRNPRNSSWNYLSLEDRRMLTGTGFESGLSFVDGAEPTIAVGHARAAVQEGITSVVVAVNGEEIELNPRTGSLQLESGDTIEVKEIRFASGAIDGVFASEGYVNKLGDSNAASAIDYSDGRFSQRPANPEANGVGGVVGGLADEWVVGAGWDRLTLTLIHYGVDSIETADRVSIDLQVDSADFVFDTEVLDQVHASAVEVGEEVRLPGAWQNLGSGEFHNYAEVDIYHSSDPETIVWAGAIVGTATAGATIEGEFLNTNGTFSETWTPEVSGDYILRYYLDPELIVTESSELNNRYDITLSVSPTVVENADLRFTFINEQQYAWGFGVQNDSGNVIEQWAVKIENANYKIAAENLTNNSAFELITTENQDGTYDHLFVGTSSIGAFQGIPGGNIEWRGVNFGFDAKSDGFIVGDLVG